MARSGTRFFCTSCGGETLKWEGRCPACGDWNTLAEAPSTEGREGRRGRGGPGGPPGPGGPGRARPLRELGGEDAGRRAVEPRAFHRVLGGGLVPGSLVLLGGAPGIGKSTFLLQVAGRLRREGADVLYASGEESPGQVRLRADRLGDGASDVHFLSATDVDGILEAAGDLGPELLVVDSVQTLSTGDLDSAAGNVSQVRECAARLQAFAKGTGTATFLVGHVTKDGGIAGPRTLEHMVDVVLQFEGRRSSRHRILRATKNRFGSADELAVFRMTGRGLEAVDDPSALFLEDRPERASGSAVAVPLHGSRPLLAEVQTLTGRSSYGHPQRVTTGFPSTRLSMLLTVLERRAGLDLSEADVFLNVIGGLTLTDPAADLAVAAALISVETDRPLPADLAFIGELGLGGEVRGVAQGERRLQEVDRAGLSSVAVPSSLTGEEGRDGPTLHPVGHVGDLRSLLEPGEASG